MQFQLMFKKYLLNPKKAIFHKAELDLNNLVCNCGSHFVKFLQLLDVEMDQIYR